MPCWRSYGNFLVPGGRGSILNIFVRGYVLSNGEAVVDRHSMSGGRPGTKYVIFYSYGYLTFLSNGRVSVLVHIYVGIEKVVALLPSSKIPDSPLPTYVLTL